MNDDFLNRLAVWLAPTSIQLTTEQLETYRSTVSVLADVDDMSDLVEAAHGNLSEPMRVLLTATIVSHDPVFVGRDKDELLIRLAGAIVVARLESGGEGAIATALLVQSARFSGMQPRLDELPKLADDLVRRASTSVRQRAHVPRAARKSLPAEAEMSDAVNVINAVLKRTYDTLSEMEKRLGLMDEEVNALWWARSDVSTSRGERWDSMDSITRVVTSALELHDLISFYPPTQGQLSLLSDVRGDVSGVATLSEVGHALRDTPVAESSGGKLLPLTTAAHLWRTYDGEKKTIAVLLSKAGFDSKREVQLDQVGAQLLRERYLTESQ